MTAHSHPSHLQVVASVTYRLGGHLDVDAVIDLYADSTLGARRPIADRDRMQAMLAHANLIVSAWDGERLIGLSRSMTDTTYATYLADLVVRQAYQRGGIGRELIRQTQAAAPQAMVILLAAPEAETYYPRIGMTQIPQAFILKANERV